MLAMVAQTPLGVRQPTSSLTTIATVRRLDMLAPTGHQGFKYPSARNNVSRQCSLM